MPSRHLLDSHYCESLVKFEKISDQKMQESALVLKWIPAIGHQFLCIKGLF
jgi:hypothetical protein